MKTIFIILITYSSIITASEVSPQASDMKFITDFTTFSCKSFSDKVSAPDDIVDLQVEYTKLGISSSTRRVLIDIKSLDGDCFYSADYSRIKGTTQLNFEKSYMTKTTKCSTLKDKLDEIMKPGFKYRIKFNAYISMLFLKKMKGQCEDVSGNNLIEFQWIL
ncbi:hypothetical protein [Halobacteriovorax sp. JY17]|uniref:hypothetical protein n=1 Tax=Halobacteriovorax sp. JY17 TaxID=2014617 RepID=UPI000C398F38|nr:hypothetical protein [Halobacteriovorax sp. JY17]PIK13778.1 MAG: hypothetical protein CES88_12375 [Halobacteriovorax sp. JY17]